MIPHMAGCAVWAGIVRLYEAGRGWATVTVGSHLGFQLGSRSAAPEEIGAATPVWDPFPV